MDFYGGHDAALNSSIQTGWFNLVNPFPPDTNDVGTDIPQMYLSMHLPILTKNGTDIYVGHAYTYMGAEVIPAPSTDFYSHQYEFFYAIPFYHTGIWSVTHVGDTVQLVNWFNRGWDDFYDDDNKSWSYLGGLIWNSCDGTQNLTVTWITGPEQPQNNSLYRTQFIAYYQKIFGHYNEWRFKFGGNYAWEPTPQGTVNSQNNWYGCTAYLFYTCDPRLILGARAEWFRDEDGVRVQAGVPDSYYEVTLGFTYKCYQNLRIRPEVRWDWAQNSTPYDDGTDSNQFTAAVDFIWEF